MRGKDDPGVAFSVAGHSEAAVSICFDHYFGSFCLVVFVRITRMEETDSKLLGGNEVGHMGSKVIFISLFDQTSPTEADQLAFRGGYRGMVQVFFRGGWAVYDQCEVFNGCLPSVCGRQDEVDVVEGNHLTFVGHLEHSCFQRRVEAETCDLFDGVLLV